MEILSGVLGHIGALKPLAVPAKTHQMAKTAVNTVAWAVDLYRLLSSAKSLANADMVIIESLCLYVEHITSCFV